MNRDAKNELDALLGLRVFATFLVVFGHTIKSYRIYPGLQWPDFPYLQSVSVTLFFCVSGYTIAWVCDTRRDIGGPAFARFSFDRFMRLSIPLVPVLLIFGIMEPLVIPQHPYLDNLNLWDGLGNALFLQNMGIAPLGPLPDFHFGVQPFGLNRPLWTLSIEFWLYIAFGAVFFLLSATGRQRIWLAAIAGFALLLLMPYVDDRHGAGLPIIWAMSAGLYFVVKRLPPMTARLRLMVLPVWLIAFACMFRPEFWGQAEYGKLFMLILFANFAGFMLVVPGLRLPRIISAPGLFLSGFCYTVYLTHYPVLYWTRSYVPSTEAGAWFVILLCFAVGWLFSLPFEARYKTIRDWVWNHLFRRRA
jgi:peptidoglycan/LPS O-acetylase OafA/YrhL